MKISELTQWHLQQLQKLSEKTEVKFNSIEGDAKFLFWSGNQKEGWTELWAKEEKFEIYQRYNHLETMHKSDIWESLTDWVY